MPKDPYVVLDLPGDATAEQIREQYRLLVHAWHPDKFRTPKQRLKAEEHLKDINAAYEMLMDRVTQSNPAGDKARTGAENYRGEDREETPVPVQSAAEWAAAWAAAQTAAPPAASARGIAGQRMISPLGMAMWGLLAAGIFAVLILLLSPGLRERASDLVYSFPSRSGKQAEDIPPFQPGVQAPAPQVASLAEAQVALKTNIPFLDELADEVRVVAPGEQVYTINDLGENEVMLGWKLCTQTQTILDTYWPNLTYNLSVDRQQPGSGGFHMVDFTTTIDTLTNGQQQARCRLLYAVLSAWPLGEHQIEVSIRSSAPLDTGWEQFPNGLFSKRVYQVMVTRRMFQVK